MREAREAEAEKPVNSLNLHNRKAELAAIRRSERE